MWVFSRLLGSYELLCGVPWWWCLRPGWPSFSAISYQRISSSQNVWRYAFTECVITHNFPWPDLPPPPSKSKRNHDCFPNFQNEHQHYYHHCQSATNTKQILLLYMNDLISCFCFRGTAERGITKVISPCKLSDQSWQRLTRPGWAAAYILEAVMQLGC